jgi:glycerol-3-phosphate dehydrogenase
VQNYGVSEAVAKHLTHAYGSAAFAVCELAKPTSRGGAAMGVPTDGGAHVGRLLVPDYPYIEAEVLYACRHEMAVSVKDMLTLRTRLAYLNSEAAKQAIDRVADLMAKELGWSKRERERQVAEARKYIGDFGGPVADKRNAKLKAATYTDLHDVFVSMDTDGSGMIEVEEFRAAATRLGFPFKSEEELQAKFARISGGKRGISEAKFIEWWNGRSSSQGAMKRLQRTLSLSAEGEVALEKTLFTEDDRDKERDSVNRALFSMQTERAMERAEKEAQKKRSEAVVKALEDQKGKEKK